MSNRYEQVLLTYLRQWQFWAYLAAWVAMFPLLGDAADVVAAGRWLFIFLSFAATGPAAVIGHAKQQMADARASLMPGFRTPHVIVAVACRLPLIGLMPLLTHRALDVPLLGLTRVGRGRVRRVRTPRVLPVASRPSRSACAAHGTAADQPASASRRSDAHRRRRPAGLASCSPGRSCVLGGDLLPPRDASRRHERVRPDPRRPQRLRVERRAHRPAPSALPREPSLLTRLQLAAADRRLRAVRNVFARRHVAARAALDALGRD